MRHMEGRELEWVLCCMRLTEFPFSQEECVDILRAVDDEIEELLAGHGICHLEPIVV